MNPPYSRDALNSRVAQRWALHYKLQFACPDFTGEGVTLDVSAGGLCIVTNREIPRGVEIYARLVLADNTSLDVQTATVKWCDNGKVGFEISEMAPSEALRLLQLLSLFGGSAITYSKQYNAEAKIIGSCLELGKCIVESLEAYSQT
jgi:hypothetical protein